MTELCEKREEYVEVPAATIDGDAFVIKRLLDQGKRVLIPYDHYACEVLRKNGIKFVLVLPRASMAEEMIGRSLFYTETEAWKEKLEEASREECYTRVILTKSNSYLSDLVVYIENLFAGSN